MSRPSPIGVTTGITQEVGMQINPIQSQSDFEMVVAKVERIEQLPSELRSSEVRTQRAGMESVTERVQRLQQTLGTEGLTLKFRRDDRTKQLVIELVDAETGSQIRQIPNEVSLRLVAVHAKLHGQLVDEAA
jgi:uncharacterized FlaG/YvyC family protein